MDIKEIMTSDPQYIDPGATVQEAAAMMKTLDVGLVPVGDGRRLHGMLTDRDIVIRACAKGLVPAATRVMDIMTPEVIYAYEDQPVDEAVRLMEENQIRRLIILNRDKKMTGVVALGDLATRTPETGKKAEALEAVSAH